MFLFSTLFQLYLYEIHVSSDRYLFETINFKTTGRFFIYFILLNRTEVESVYFSTCFRIDFFIQNDY